MTQMGTPAPATITPIADALVDQRCAESPSWLQVRRRAAWDAFQTMPWPSSTRDEDWRRTDISKLNWRDFSVDVDAEGPRKDLLTKVRADIADALPDVCVVTTDQRGAVTVSGADALLAQGVIICSLDEATCRHSELVQRALAILPAESPLLALWNALWRGGVFVHVPASVTAALPIVVVHASAGPGAASFPATVISADAATSVSVTEIHVSPTSDDVLFCDAATAIVAARDARVDHAVIQRQGLGVWHMATHRAQLGAGAQLRGFVTSVGSRLQKTYLEALLEGAGAAVEFSGIAFCGGKQHLDHQSLQAHRAPDTSSKLILKTAVRDTARSVYSGLIDVDKIAQRTDGYVQNRNLVLNQGAKADSIPRLEIRANDVRCGHGATAGHIDDEQRFYLMARGIPAADADRLIVRGFFEDVVAQVPHPGVATMVNALLDQLLGAVPIGVGLDAALVASEVAE